MFFQILAPLRPPGTLWSTGLCPQRSLGDPQPRAGEAGAPTAADLAVKPRTARHEQPCSQYCQQQPEKNT